MSCTPRTARIVMWTPFPRALASREENGERNGEAGEDTRSELVVAGDRRGLLRRRLGEQHPVDDLVPQSVVGPRAVVLVGQSRTSARYRVPRPGLAHAVSVPRTGSSRGASVVVLQRDIVPRRAADHSDVTGARAKSDPDGERRFNPESS